MIVNKTQNQFKIRLTGLTERAQKMNELEEWEAIYKEKYLIELHIFIFLIRYVFVHLSRSCDDARNHRRYTVPTHEI